MTKKGVLVGVVGLRALRLGWAWKVPELERKPVCLEGRGHERWSERCVYRENGSAGFGTQQRGVTGGFPPRGYLS